MNLRGNGAERIPERTGYVAVPFLAPISLPDSRTPYVFSYQRRAAEAAPNRGDLTRVHRGVNGHKVQQLADGFEQRAGLFECLLRLRFGQMPGRLSEQLAVSVPQRSQYAHVSVSGRRGGLIVAGKSLLETFRQRGQVFHAKPP